MQCFGFHSIKRIKFKYVPLHSPKFGQFSEPRNINLTHYLERHKHFFLGLMQALKSDEIFYTYETQQMEVFY